MEKEATIKVSETGTIFFNETARKMIEGKGEVVIVIIEEGRVCIRLVKGEAASRLTTPGINSYTVRFTCRALADWLGKGRFKVEWKEREGVLEVGERV